jgi:nucleotide-binding universal stress UspA family protein
MMKILIGHDGSQSADAALVDLQRAGLPAEAEALVVSVADVMMVSATPAYELAGEALMSRRVTAGLLYAQKQTEHVLNEAKDFARRASEQVRSYFPHWNVRAETLAGSAAWELISKADEWKPDLIVVGSHGRSAVSRFILGSVSKKVVTDSDHSVRVWRGDLERISMSLRNLLSVWTRQPKPNKPFVLWAVVFGRTELRYKLSPLTMAVRQCSHTLQGGWWRGQRMH